MIHRWGWRKSTLSTPINAYDDTILHFHSSRQEVFLLKLPIKQKYQSSQYLLCTCVLYVTFHQIFVMVCQMKMWWVSQMKSLYHNQTRVSLHWKTHDKHVNFELWKNEYFDKVLDSERSLDKLFYTEKGISFSLRTEYFDNIYIIDTERSFFLHSIHQFKERELIQISILYLITLKVKLNCL